MYLIIEIENTYQGFPWAMAVLHPYKFIAMLDRTTAALICFIKNWSSVVKSKPGSLFDRRKMATVITLFE